MPSPYAFLELIAWDFSKSHLHPSTPVLSGGRTQDGGVISKDDSVTKLDGLKTAYG